MFNTIFQNDIKTPLKMSKHKVLLKDPCFMFPVLYSPNEPEHEDPDPHLSMRIRIQEAYPYADPCGSGSETLTKSIRRFLNGGKNLFYPPH